MISRTREVSGSRLSSVNLGRLRCRTLRALHSLYLLTTWGYAPLHPKLYAAARAAG